MRLQRLAAAARASRQLWIDDCAARDAALYDLDKAGTASLRELARTCDLSSSHVQRILVDETARRQAANAPE